MYGYIYLTINNVNNKKYIGQKKSSTFLGNKYLGSGVILEKAIEKYGKENFTVILLETADDQFQLDELEITYISKYRKSGEELYNIAPGGQTLGGSLGNTTKNKIWVNDGNQHFMISKSQLSEYLNKGYKRGSLNTKGYVWITNGKDTKHIPESQLSMYLDNGYKRGRGSSNKLWITNGFENRLIDSKSDIPLGFYKGRTNTSNQPAKNKKYMYKDDSQILVNPEEIQTYLNLGYILGKHPRSSIKGKSGHSNNLGKKWLTNGISDVLTKDIEHYLELGYKFGRTIYSHSK